MGSFSSSFGNLFSLVFLLVLLSGMSCEAQLSTTFYNKTCPGVLTEIRNAVRRAVSAERRMAASLIRLHFHDCFVQGCDGSILLDESPTIRSEKTAIPNINSARGYNVIEDAKRALEGKCPSVVSCADILTVAARDASVAVGGPTWEVKLGRKDSTTANRDRANTDLPSPFADANALIAAFAVKGLNTRDMIALSGSHTLGQAQCFLFRSRIYSNGTDIDPGFARTRRNQCPQTGRDATLAPLDLVTPNSFDNNYYKNLVQRKGLLISDQVLFTSASTNSIVTEYSKSPAAFAADFASAMKKMSEIEPLLAPNGIVRKTCGAIN
ncbi:lignin-forming anionic peroxidase-like [Primulina eburnea]|uniref:lignin-forming anionic peroxidase-like n=1 Tax=Primulina eburnea TaxID=1245227 RepID=UPI003C6BEF42